MIYQYKIVVQYYEMYHTMKNNEWNKIGCTCRIDLRHSYSNENHSP